MSVLAITWNRATTVQHFGTPFPPGPYCAGTVGHTSIPSKIATLINHMSVNVNREFEEYWSLTPCHQSSED